MEWKERRGEESIHVVGIGGGVRLVDADEYEESRADRRHHSPLHLRSPRRSLQGSSSLPRESEQIADGQ